MAVLTGLISDYGCPPSPALRFSTFCCAAKSGFITQAEAARIGKGLRSPVARRDYPLSTYAGRAIFSLSPAKIPCKLFELRRSS